MGKILFITGTGTDVGKTALSLAVLFWARQRGLKTAYHKPIQCGTYAVGNPSAQGGDAEWIRNAMGDGSGSGSGTGSADTSAGIAEAHVTYRFPLAASPHLAAERAGESVDLGRIRRDLERMQAGCDLVVLEGSGGAAVPVNRQGAHLAGLAAEMSIPCLIACAPGLGTLHHTLATVAFLRGLPAGMAPMAGFAFCHRDASAQELAEDNRATLQSLTGLPCFGALPYSAPLAAGLALSASAAAAWISPLSPSLEAWWNPART